MTVHWTYEEFKDTDDLEQGDILQPTNELKALFSDVHPHFLDAKYVAFMVATQSCDLVLRRSKPKAPYINVAVIRPLRSIAHKLIEQVIKPVSPGNYLRSDKRRVLDLLNKVFNQNEQALGLFFLYKDADFGIAEESIALLRVTVSLKSDHYEILRNARVGRLNPEFRAKLGWLLGNLFSRPATRDWGERDGGGKQLEMLVTDFSQEQVKGQGPYWIDDELVSAAMAQGLKLEGLSREDFEKLRTKPEYEVSLELVEAELTKVAPGLEPEVIRKLTNRLRNNGRYKKLFLRKDI